MSDHKEQNMMSIHRLTKSTLTVAFLLFSFFSFAEVSPDIGKNLFKANCAQCHAKNMKSDATGPALGGVEERWADYPREDLYRWIRQSQTMINVDKHPRALELWSTWKPTVMLDYPSLSDDDIESLLVYIQGMYDGIYGAVAGSPVVVGGEKEEKADYTWLYYVLFGFLALLSVLLFRVVGSLNKIAAEKEGEVYEGKTLWETLTSRNLVTLVLFCLVVLGGYTTVNNAVSLGRQQNYAPDQPIKFSHETHAGVHQIECQYCHDGARRSKHSVIPAANTCMNCHRAIKVGSEYGTQELTKIYASVGYNPSNNTYIDKEVYDKMSEEEVKAIYTKWIGDEYVKATEGTDVLDEKGEEEVNKQWNHIVESLTNEQKTKVQGPIEWVRIHNLPDHVYFNHAQHVTVGQLECQTCHGKVEEMEVVHQHSPLSMGWCINCHRKTEVKFNDNEYYASFAKYHEEMKAGKRDKVTVEDIGGLECQKCHY